ncbi:MAG TPA: Gldg family protein [Chloroflexota bacterium]|nr:Gldg family protein [Chloroflexota bacterium]
MIERLRTQLPTIFTILGVLCLVVAAGLYLVYAQLDRWVLTSGAIGVIFLVYAVLERPQAVTSTVTSREARYGGNTVLLTGAFIGIVALANVLSSRHSYTWDLTETKDFSLSPQSVQVAQQLDKPVKITAFYQQGQSGQQEMQDLIKQYQAYTDKITYEFVDPVLKPGVARDMKIENYPTTVLETPDGKRQTVSSATEGEMTSALLKLERGTPKQVGWITGHGELDTESQDQRGASEAKRLIEAENYKVVPLTLLAQTEIPKDYAAVVLAGPRQALLPQEATVLDKYLEAGGKLLVMLDPRSPGNPVGLLNKWGLDVGNGILLDFSLNVQGDPLTPAVVKYAPNPVMKNVASDTTGRYITIFPGATMVRAKSDKDVSLQIQNIAQSSDNSWVESDERIDPRAVKYDEGKDVKGPVPIAVSVLKSSGSSSAPSGSDQSQQNQQSSTRIVAIGNSTFASNNLLSIMQVPGNRDLLLNSIGWLTEDEGLLGVRAKVTKDRTLILTGTQQNLMLYSSTLFLPLAVLAVGAYVWWSRR